MINSEILKLKKPEIFFIVKKFFSIAIYLR